MRLVIALGGNALLRRGEALTAANQRRNVDLAADALAPVIKAGHQVVLTHGNGPQVGLLALQGEAYSDSAGFPLDVLGAQTEGMIGYLLERALTSACGPAQEFATLLTQTEVSPTDPAFLAPTKPIGPVYSEIEARAMATARGWTITRDGQHWRRVVPSPDPLRILEIATIRRLVDLGVTVICAGGGGIPVMTREDGSLVGVEAVIDKDLASALLADALGADGLLLLTDVEGVFDAWGTPTEALIRTSTPAAMADRQLAAGSMGPKVAAACRFAVHPGRFAAIGALGQAQAMLDGSAGTRIIPDDSRVSNGIA
ncbi:MAG: carbamate kinase [Pseudomonadota bacterium]